MLQRLFCQFSPDEWTAIFSGIATLVIVVGTVIALINLRIIAKSQHLDSVREFTVDLSNTAEDRRFVLQEYSFSAKERSIPYETEKKVQNVVNSLNRTGLLLENGMLSPRLVFSISHTTIIRCYHKVEFYLKFHEERIGGRYGRRVERMSIRAKRYHDIMPHHRITAIKIDPGPDQEPIIIYRTSARTGIAGIFQKIEWGIRRILGVY